MKRSKCQDYFSKFHFQKKKVFKIISSITSYSGVLVRIRGRDLLPSSVKPDPYLDQPWFHTLLLFSDLNIGEIFSQDQPE